MVAKPAVQRERDKLAEALTENYERLLTLRAPYEALWQQIARYVIPRRATFTEEVSPGVERNRQVLDSTAPRSLEMFASFLHNLLNNPARQWFRLRLLERDATGIHEVKEAAVLRWREQVEATMLEEMSGREANTYSQLHPIYLDLGAFGTAVLFVDLTAKRRLRVRSYHLADCAIDESEGEHVDTVYRRSMLSARQAKQRWKDQPLGNSIDGSGRRDQNQRHWFYHACFPSTDENMARLFPARLRKLAGEDGYLSAWVNKADGVTVSTGYYEEFPYMVPRWYKVRGELYGSSPAMTVLPDIRMVNRMSETVLRGAEKIVDPPLLIPDGGLVSPVRMFPGGISFSEGDVTPRPLIPPGASRIEVGETLLKSRQDNIREGFFVPLFVTPQQPVKTATQVLQETDERNRAVSPMIVRAQDELFQAYILRTYNLLRRAGRLPAPPASIAGRNIGITVEYVSPLMASQKEVEGLAMMRLFQGLAPWSEIDRGIFDNFDVDEVARLYTQATGAPISIMRDKKKVEEVRNARMQQEQQAKMTETTVKGLGPLAQLIKAGQGQSNG